MPAFFASSAQFATACTICRTAARALASFDVNHPLSECQQRRNHNIAKVRARVEHIFAAIEQMGGKRIRTIGQVRASFAMTMMVVTYNIKRLAFLEKGLIRAVVCL